MEISTVMIGSERTSLPNISPRWLVGGAGVLLICLALPLVVLFMPFVPAGTKLVVAEARTPTEQLVLVQTANELLDGFRLDLYAKVPHEAEWRRYFIDSDAPFLYWGAIDSGVDQETARVSGNGFQLATLYLELDQIYLDWAERNVTGHDKGAPPPR